jgi:CheY-specific phosphatase CheX
MPFNKTIIPRVMASILGQTREVLGVEAIIAVDGAETFDCDVSQLQLHDMTVIAGLGGPISLLIAFSFDASLVDALFVRVTDGIEVPPGETELYRRETAAEIVNTILGLCTSDLQNIEESIALSPPVVIEDARCIHRPKNAVFANMRIRTEKGIVSVGFVGPRELFDDHLNYQIQGKPDVIA